MLGFITDRTMDNVKRAKALAAKGWDGMSALEKAEWLGDPLKPEAIGYTDPVNLLPVVDGWVPSEAVILTNCRAHFAITSHTESGITESVIIIGNAEDFANKTLTLSARGFVSSDIENSTIHDVGFCWYDEYGMDVFGGRLSAGGSVTVALSDYANDNNRAYLALRIFSDNSTVGPHYVVVYRELMVEYGGTKHDYIPYTAILPTATTKGVLNYCDLNRIESAIAEISEKQGLGLEAKTDWKIGDFVSGSDYNRINENLKAIDPRTYLLNNFHFNNLNRIEKSLESFFV